jgi:hypothetical protein|tara:strand:- start:362 stop:658 length:297 start_codon:yes stop_codon:yes gene_type:complete
MRNTLLAVAFSVSTMMGAQTALAETEDFEAMCREVSAKDGVPQEQIEAFCPCLAEKAAADESIDAELRASVVREGDAEARLAGLSEKAAAAVQACQGA